MYRGEASRKRLLGWWYVCIGLGFALLAARSHLAGARTVAVALRLVIALGFLILGWLTLGGNRTDSR